MRKTAAFFAILLFLLLNVRFSFSDWVQIGPARGGTPEGRQYFAMAPLSKSKLLLYGGSNSWNTKGMGDTWIFDANRNRWTKMSPTVRNGYLGITYQNAMAYLGGESVLMQGGSGYRGATWRYDLSSNTWTNLGVGDALGNRLSHRICYIEEGKVLLFGGRENGSETWLYDANTNQWQLRSPEIEGEGFSGRYDFGMAYIGQGRVVMFGGQSGGEDQTWIYDLGQDQWRRMMPDMVGGTLTARYGLSMTYIGDDRVLLFGGLSSPIYYQEIWMYDLSDNRWTNLTYSTAGASPKGRYHMEIGSVGLGQVVMFGGWATDGGYFNGTWRFSVPDNIPDTINWQITANSVQLSWSVPEAFANAGFSIYRDGLQIIPSVAPGATIDGTIPYVYQDTSPDTGKIYRYQIKEIYPVMNSEIFYPEIAVPYCQ